jgi:hypothetical protein
VTDTEFFVKGFQREMVGLLSSETAKEVCVWFKASDYRIIGKRIRPRHPKGRGPTWLYPLTDPSLFLSFARLGGGGKPFEEQVLSWVRDNGLLRREDYEDYYVDATEDGEVNQASMTFDEFNYEVTLANNMLRLYKQIRDGAYDALRSRVSLDRITIPDSTKDAGYYGSAEQETSRAVVVVDGIETEVHMLADEPPSDNVIHEWATEALEYIVEQKLTRMGVVFSKDIGHPRPLSTILREVHYRPRLTLRCPDLESALWFQFASLIGDKRVFRECSECAETFVGRKQARTCSDRCRKTRSRRLKKQRGE